MPRFITGTCFPRAQRGPRPVRARLGAGRHRKGHPRPRQPHQCPALRPRPASRPVTEGTRRSALLSGPGEREPRAVSRSQGQAHTLAQTKPGRPPRWSPTDVAHTPSPTKAGSAAHRRQLAGWHHRGSFPVRVCRRQGVFTALFRRGRAEKKPNAPSTTEGGGFRGGRPAARPHGSLRGAFPVGNWPFGSIQPDVGSEINIF